MEYFITYTNNTFKDIKHHKIILLSRVGKTEQVGQEKELMDDGVVIPGGGGLYGGQTTMGKVQERLHFWKTGFNFTHRKIKWYNLLHCQQEKGEKLSKIQVWKAVLQNSKGYFP